MTREPKVHRDGQLSCLAGAHEGISPLLLRRDHLARAVNCSLRGGFPETRSGWSQKRLTYPNPEAQTWVNANTFEGASVFDPFGKAPEILFSLSGRVFKMDMEWTIREIYAKTSTTLTADFISPPIGTAGTFYVSDPSQIFIGYPITIKDGIYIVTEVISSTVTALNYSGTPGVLVVSGAAVYPSDPNDSHCEQAWFEEIDKWLLIQNGIDRALIYDGVELRRADTAHVKPEVPAGRQMAFFDSIGRLVVAVDGNTLAIGDVVGGPTTGLTFSEETYIAEGGRFKVPRKWGPITSLTNIASLDSTLGRGPLLVGTSRGILTLNLSSNRQIWKDVQSPLQSVGLIDYGPRNQSGTVNVNGDVFFRATDGIRSFVMARREFGSWGNVPVSTEMEPVLARDEQALLKFGSGAVFDNRLLMTCAPRRINPRGCYHNGLIALDFHMLSSMGLKSSPAYDGLWSGLKIYQLLKFQHEEKERLFAFTRESDNGLGFWELMPGTRFDNGSNRVISHIETRSFKGRDETELKELVSCEIWIDNVEGTVDFDLKYKPDEYPCWFDWATRSECSKTCQEADPDVCLTATTYAPGYKTRMSFGKPPHEEIASECRPAALGYSFTLRLEWTGRARVKKVMVKFAEVDEAPFAPC